ncbi:MAG: DNA internalization-related competence protein ComEC/Rec2 [Gemmatimonadota bacterium]
MVGLALAFCAGVALGGGGVVGGLALVVVLKLLRPRWPLRRPGVVLVAVGLSGGAGALHVQAVAPHVQDAAPASRNPAPFGRGRADRLPGVRPTSAAQADAVGAGWREAVADRLSARIHATFPQEGAMVDALLLARRDGMDPSVRNAFTRTGAAHLLAISGFHVGVLAGWALVILRAVGWSRRGAALGAAGLVWGYVALLGFPTSAVRAGLLLTGAAAGRIRGRPVHPLGGWGTALLLVALGDPGSLAGAGAQLSFAGALGLLLWARPWGEALDRAIPTPPRLTGVGSAAARATGASAAAQVATLPLAVWHFQRVAVLALPATLLVTPLISLALPGALLALVLAGLGIPGAALLAQGVEGLLWASRALLEAMAGLDPGWMLGPVSVAGATGAAVLAWRATAPAARRRWRPGAVLGAVLLALAWAPVVPVRAGGPTLRIHVLDVGQGDAVAVQGPAGRWILVDAGPGSGERLARELAVLGVRRLDLLVLSHPDLDHIGGAAHLLRVLPVGTVLGGGSLRGTAAFKGVAEAASARGIPWRTVRAGDRWRLGEMEFRVLHPSGLESPDTPPNDRSVVFTLSWGAFDALFTGDISREVEAELIPALLPVEMLKVAHHGSRTSSAEAFLDRVRPELSAVSVGRRNRHGHPAPEVMARLRRSGGRIVRTDRMGRVTILARRDGSFTTRSARGSGDPRGD